MEEKDFFSPEERFTVIRKNIIDYHCDPCGNPQEILDKLDEQGKFCDIDYTTQNWTKWGPFLHMRRLKDISAMFASERNAFYQDGRILEAVKRGFTFYLAGNFKSENWWMNDKGVPETCSMIRLFLGERLGTELGNEMARLAKGKATDSMEFSFYEEEKPGSLRPYPSCGCHMTGKLRHTHVQLAAENGDAKVAMERIEKCLEALDYELKTITYPFGHSPGHLYPEEHCIKTDYSYHEHENCMVMNTYGEGFVEEIADLLLFWRGSGLELGKNAKEQLVNLLLDGYSIMRYRGASPMMTIGRNVASADVKRYHRQEYMDSLVTICDELLEQGLTYRKEEIISFRDMAAAPMEGAHFHRTKYFWHSDLISHNRAGYQFMVHGVSNRMKRPESILKKNIQGMFLGDGSYNIMETGYEYEGIAPIMDWHKVPGTTVDQGVADLNPECEIDTKIDTLRIFGGAKGTTSFVGGVSDEEYGLFAMDYDHLQVKAKKAWFCLDEGVVCLGTEICGEGDGGVFTTVDQRFAGETVMVDGERIAYGQNASDRIIDSCQYVLSGSMGYLFLQPTEKVHLQYGCRIGCWNLVDKDSGTLDEVSGEMLLLGIDHGIHPQNADYAYMLLPGMNREKMENFVSKVPVRVIKNTKECQAIWYMNKKLTDTINSAISKLDVCSMCDDMDAKVDNVCNNAQGTPYNHMLQAVFYQPGSITIQDILEDISKDISAGISESISVQSNLTVQVSQACTLLLRFYENSWRMWLSNPEHEIAEISVTLSGAVNQEIVFRLEEGYRFNNLGRPLGYDSEVGFLPYRGAQGDEELECFH